MKKKLIILASILLAEMLIILGIVIASVIYLGGI